MSRGDLTEAERRVLKASLPIEPENRSRGRRPEQNRPIINGILWRLRCGAPWRDVPQNTAVGIQSIGGSGDGARPGSGRPSL
nr:transposase [Sphingobium fuliginis]